MRVVAVTFGTEGDSRPMAALCGGLRDAGHAVTLLAERSAESFAASLGVPFEALAGDMAAELAAATPQLMHKGHDAGDVARALARIAERNTASWMRSVLDHARGADVIVCAGLAIYVGLSCAEHLRIRVVGAGLQPMMATGDFPSPFFPAWRLPRTLNRLSHQLVLALMWRAFRAAINDARREVTGQPPRRRQWAGYPCIFGISPTLVPQPRDWPPRFSIVGCWWPPPDRTWRPDPALIEFLSRGEPPVYIGFGSMIGFDRARTLSSVLDALAGRRALVAQGWSGFGSGNLPDHVRSIGWVPHEWLFPRVATVVHHGGAGTTHSAAKAGVPSVVLPLAGDQFFWADRLLRSGVAPPPLAQRRLDARALAQRLTLADASAMRGRARIIAGAMQGEDGVRAGVAAIEACMRER